MSHDGSFVGAFNLSSQAGVAAVLAAIRASQLTSGEKNELRDLVFSYTNGGGDASVRIALEQKLSAHAIVPVVPQRGGGAAPVLPFGTYRPTPNFKAPSPASVSVSPPVPTASVPPAPGVPNQTSSQPTPSSTPTQAPVTPTSVTDTVVPAAPVVNPVAGPVVSPVLEASPAPVMPAVPVPPPAPVVSVGVQPEAVYLERIRQIKTAVNSKVGNPVNLVDINNAVGREYMNALLEAMKKLGSGAVSEMEPAMQRLETAFVAVQEAIKEHEQHSAQSPTPTPVKIPTPGPAASSFVPQPVPGQTPLTPPVVASSIEAVSIQAPAPEEVVPAPVFSSVPVNPPEASSPAPEPVRESVFGARVPVVDVPLPTRPMMSESVNEEAGPSGFEIDRTPIPPVTPSPSLAQEPKLRTPNDLPDAASVQTGEKGDPLFTKEVDDGLEQLLSDWSLSKKSGLFGTGPKGREHPLFKKISGLQVPLLLAGRFDGANQEIRQSITDYMNGWRYEQGIIYQPGETFERYLRRVIRHILDLQKKRRTP